MTVNIIGAGFSGLVTAFYLVESGVKVRIYEKHSACGGLIRTERTPYGLVEFAANAIINSLAVEELFDKLQLPALATRKESRARYIFRGKPRRWPLSIDGSVRMIAGVPGLIGRWSRAKPRPMETAAQWGNRVIGEEGTRLFMAPALQGIYAGDPEHMSASLIFSRFFRMRPFSFKRPRVRGSVSPPGGMGQLIEKLEEYLRAKGTEFHFNKTIEASNDGDITVFCGSCAAAAKWLVKVAPVTAAKLARFELLPLTTISCFFDPVVGETQGFGILFPRGEGVQALGVLFNNHIFELRSERRSETWIYSGVDAGLETVLSDRKKLGGTIAPLDFRVQRWPQAIPHYNLALEETLREGLNLPENIFLMGNYLGDLGLGRMLERAKKLAGEIKSQLEDA